LELGLRVGVGVGVRVGVGVGVGVRDVDVAVARSVVAREEELVNAAVLVRGEHHVVEHDADGGVAEGLDG
jgi:hypothetical protein